MKSTGILHELRSLRNVFILPSSLLVALLLLLSTASNSDAVEDITAPTGTVSINNGSPATNNVNVTLTLAATDDIGTVASMQFSNDGATWSTVESYVTTTNWTLAGGEGAKTVYARFSDNSGNWSPLPGFSATIDFDTTPPGVSSFTKIVAGNSHTLGIKADGTLWAWGSNRNGQLGDGTFTGKYAPVQIGRDRTWLNAAAGTTHSAAVAGDHSLWTWGSNAYGELGNGGTTKSSLPVRITTPDKTWRAVDCGNGFTVALTESGEVWAWGRNNYGQLGDNTVNDATSPVRLSDGNATDWFAISAGSSHVAALKGNGELWVWGYNSSGQLGLGSTTNHLAPVRLESPVATWIAVSAGGSHTIALDSGDQLWAWGNNATGQLGNNSTTSSTAPVFIGTDWKAISAGMNHTVALKSNDTLWTWGDNAEGQLGDNTTTRRKVPTQIAGNAAWAAITAGSYFTAAVRPDGTLWACGLAGYGQLGFGSDPDTVTSVGIGQDTWLAVEAGYTHTVGIKSDGTLWSWGINDLGQLGDSTNTGRRTAPYKIGTSSNWVGVSSQLHHTLALDSSGYVWSWGWNAYGQLGQNTTTNNRTPAQVLSRVTTSNGTENIPDNQWSSVSAGANHSVGLKNDGTLWAWGNNLSGQLGLGDTTDRLISVQVGTADNWLAVSAGGNHTVALDSSNQLWAWGNNAYGQLGDGTTTGSTVPIRIGSDTDWEAIAAFTDGTLALKTDGTLWAWGNNDNGKLGDGTTTRRKSPVQVGWDNDWVAVAASYSHVLAIKEDDSLWAWGWNAYGQVGDGTVVDKYAPVPIGPDAWSQVTGGWGHSLGLKADNKLYAWGYNADGELGNSAVLNVLSPAQILGGAISINNGNGFTNSTAVTLTLMPGNPAELASMQFSNDNVDWSHAAVPYATTADWELSLGDGVKTVYAKFSDVAGNWSNVFSASIILDTTAPQITIVSPVGSTNDTTPLLEYIQYEAGPITVSVDGTAVSKVSGDSLSTLSPGPHNLRVDTSDEAGNPGYAMVTFTIDTTPPTVTITSPKGTIRDTAPYLSYSISDGTAIAKVDGVVVSTVSGSNLGQVGEGQHTIRIEATDAAGNMGFAEESFTVDSSIPLAFGAGTVTASTHKINTTLSESSTICYDINGAASVTLKIIPESLGQGGNPVLQITQNRVGAGRYCFSWDGRDSIGEVLADDAYYYVLAASDGTSTATYIGNELGGSVSLTCSQLARFNPQCEPSSIIYHSNRDLRVDIWVDTDDNSYQVANRAPVAAGTNYIFDWNGRDHGSVAGSEPVATCILKSRLQENVIITSDSVRAAGVKADPNLVHVSYGQFTAIKYVLPSPALVTVKVISPTGAATVVKSNDDQGAGEQTVEWRFLDAADSTGKGVLADSEGLYSVVIETRSRGTRTPTPTVSRGCVTVYY